MFRPGGAVPARVRRATSAASSTRTASSASTIEMVMPQNEFNSPQVFPSCTWTPQGLARLLRHLGPEMAGADVEVFLGTLERGDDRLRERGAGRCRGRPVRRGAWASSGPARARSPFVHRDHPELRIYQTEQECGDGRNDWRYCRYAWTLMRHYFTHGAVAYMYWNISLLERGGLSRWGWAQNSLVSVDAETGDLPLQPRVLPAEAREPLRPARRARAADARAGPDTRTSSRSATRTAASSWSCTTTSARSCRSASWSATG